MFKILVIDDDPVIQFILSRTLQDQGYEVIAANSSESGVAAAKAHQPALIICDWLMSGIDGLQVCRQIKAEPTLSTVFFILLTSRTDVRDRVMGLDNGADDYLSKPVEVGELLARVRAGLRLHQTAQALQQLSQDLLAQKQRFEAEIAEASDYVTSLLPTPLSGSVSSEALFIPSKQLGGDCFDYYWLDPDFLVLYLLDVSGHGLGSALMSVSIQNLLRSQALPGINFYRPEDVLSGLNEVFQMDERNPRYFTIWYGVYNRVQQRLTYATAGHPPAVLVSKSGSTAVSTAASTVPEQQRLAQPEQLQIQRLKTKGVPIGMMADAKYVSAFCNVPPASTLFLFSDGVYELRQSNNKPWTLDQLIDLLAQHASTEQPIEAALSQIRAVAKAETFEDDFSLLQLRFAD